MMIMTFKVSRTARLTTVCVATLVFAYCMVFISSNRQEIVAATAAYAAVMVVYVGTALPSAS